MDLPRARKTFADLAFPRQYETIEGLGDATRGPHLKLLRENPAEAVVAINHAVHSHLAEQGIALSEDRLAHLRYLTAASVDLTHRKHPERSVTEIVESAAIKSKLADLGLKADEIIALASDTKTLDHALKTHFPPLQQSLVPLRQHIDAQAKTMPVIPKTPPSTPQAAEIVESAAKGERKWFQFLTHDEAAIFSGKRTAISAAIVAAAGLGIAAMSRKQAQPNEKAQEATVERA